MRLVTYDHDGTGHCGLVIGDRVLNVAELGKALSLPRADTLDSTRAVLEAGAATWRELAAAGAEAEARGEGMRLDDLTLRAPIEDPDKIVCLGLNYRDHAEESGLSLPAAPMLFAKFRNSLVGPTADVIPPAESEAIDYEAELAVVIGKRATRVPAAQALDHVAGVMAFNDVTARDIQHATSQWTAGKAIDTFAPCGPCLVFLDEIDDIQNLGLRTRVNGQTVQDGTTANMIFDVATTIEFVSALMTLEPGDIIATGTPAGVGVSRDPQLLLHPGDVVEVEIDRIGTIRNAIADPVGSAPAPASAGAEEA